MVRRAIELNKGEDQSQAIAHIRKTRGAPKELEGGAVSANMTVEGAHRKLVCAYAPSKPNNDDIGTIWVRGTEDETDNRHGQSNEKKWLVKRDASRRPEGMFGGRVGM